MATATITFTVDYTDEQLSNMRDAFPNTDGSVPTNAELLANIKSYLRGVLREKYRSRLVAKATAAINITDLTVL